MNNIIKTLLYLVHFTLLCNKVFLKMRSGSARLLSQSVSRHHRQSKYLYFIEGGHVQFVSISPAS